MTTLLVLGSKPDPALPPASGFDDVACANASGYSAARLGLPVPAFTLISAILTSGIGSGRQSLQAMHGLETEVLYYFPRPQKRRKLLKRPLGLVQDFRTGPYYFRRRLHKASYTWRHFVRHDHDWYRALATKLCQGDAALQAQLGSKSPSTGIMTLVVGMSLGVYDRYILSGFSFELTHAYADNPEIDARGTRISRHTPTDVSLLGHLSRTRGDIFTTEPVVHEHTGVPLL
ncbi:MAG: hypothetical protein PVH38_07685 [Gammaproteobacteria bacterium]|jgi:hypothetical protein